MKTIIAATNFTDASNHAVAFAADVACILKARLIIFHVIDVEPATDVLFPEDFFEVARKKAAELLAVLLLEMKKRTNGVIEIKTNYRIGTVVTQLGILCSHEAPLAVFIASQFVSSFEQALWGTHAVFIVKHSAYPVVVVPANASMNGFKKVGVALDPDGNDSIQWSLLRDWLKLFNAEADIVVVLPHAALSAAEELQAIDAREQLNGIMVRTHFVTNDDVEEGIKAHIAANAPDLLIMFVKRHGIFHKSITRPFILLPPVPIMLISSKVTYEQEFPEEEAAE
ncbi:universal stress protein [Niabella sp. CC-SYL272]|uniref:universal stress protein n=1 Tax=Niabella agricola TaxID=2891571 RepID=UPI001F4821F1|nr:universal stress protein [Niabella agricola]MCF3107688.1 universal stress protein [Niabella agricola]